MHLIALVDKGDEILALKLRTLLEVVDFFLKHSEFSKGKKRKGSVIPPSLLLVSLHVPSRFLAYTNKDSLN